MTTSQVQAVQLSLGTFYQQTEPNRTELNRNIGLFSFRLSVRFMVLHCSAFGFGFVFLLKPNRGTEQTEVQYLQTVA